MAKYTFRIHKGESPNVTENGWTKGAYIGNGKEGIASIVDQLDKLPATGKVGTSIPTPFARIELFRTAFELVAQPGGASPVYQKLVSDCLDILQLLFERGADASRFEIINWNFTKEMAEIRRQNDMIRQNNTSYNALGTLANALELAFGSYDGGDSITLIKYDGILLGGTSPYSLVFTSANLIADLEAKKAAAPYDFSSNKKVPFCSHTARSLSERPVEFQQYLRSLLMNCDPWRIAQGGPLFNFWQYVSQQTQGVKEFKDDEFEENFKCVNSGSEIIVVGASENGAKSLCLRYNDLPIVPSQSHFMMKPTVNNYKRAGIRTVPLVLPNKHSQEGWMYIDDNWDTKTLLPDTFVKGYGDVKDRVLPKNGSNMAAKTAQHYPWITNADLFEDNLLDLTYALNTDKFVSAVGLAHHRYLLPIKKEYFNYFTIEDLKKNLSMKADVKEIYDNDGKLITVRTNSVTVSLVIPLDSVRNKIVLERKYVADENANEPKIKVLNKPAFGLGVFPFYRIEERNAPDALRNEYSVYLYDSSATKEQTKLHFYNFSGKVSEVTAEQVDRTCMDAGTSKVYNLRSRTSSNVFDAIEVSVKTGDVMSSGLVIPRWTEYSADELNVDQYNTIFSIDFGTSNTHVAYWDPRESCVKPLEIVSGNEQMVLLNAPLIKDNVTFYRDPAGFGNANRFAEYLREFVPSVIGSGDIKYPIKTAILEKGDNSNKSNNLFGNINVGYDIESEKIDLSKLSSSLTYKTDLKWALQKDRSDARAKYRVNAFCEQTLWMLKNILVMNRFYAKNIKIIYFYPESMMTDDRNMFEDAWNDQAKRIFSECGFAIEDNKCISELESVAPYYSLLKRNRQMFTYNSVNIDIGGGTTDILVLDKLYKKELEDGSTQKTAAYEASVQFAGNDLWGKAYPSGSENGFVEYMKDVLKKESAVFPAGLIKAYENFAGKNDPAELTSFFFKYPDFNYGLKLSNNPKLRFVMFLHYASIIWYLSDLIKHVRANQNPDFELPCLITFTGKGSEYIKLIAKKEEDITNLTYALFIAFGFKKEEFKHGFKVVYPENPKALTAEGGIYKLICDDDIQVNFKKKSMHGFLDVHAVSGRQEETEYENLGGSLLGIESECLVKDIDSKAKDVSSTVEDFINAIYSQPQVGAMLKSLSMNLDASDKDVIMDYAVQSYDAHAKRLASEYRAVGAATDKVETSLFFLAMKNLCIDLSMHFK